MSLVVPKALLIKIPEQVKRLDADVRPVQAALQQTPEDFHRVRVNVLVSVLDRVVDDGRAGIHSLDRRRTSVHQ